MCYHSWWIKITKLEHVSRRMHPQARPYTHARTGGQVENIMLRRPIGGTTSKAIVDIKLHLRPSCYSRQVTLNMRLFVASSWLGNLPENLPVKECLKLTEIPPWVWCVTRCSLVSKLSWSFSWFIPFHFVFRRDNYANRRRQSHSCDISAIMMHRCCILHAKLFVLHTVALV